VPPIDVRCRLILFGTTRQDVGAGEDPKAAFSDAIKRAAVDFGIGQALHALGAPWLGEGDADGELRCNRRGRLVLDARSEAWLRGAYRRWLEQRGGRLFGEPLDHGDEPGAPGVEADAAGGVEPSTEPDQEAAAGQVSEPRRPVHPEQTPARGDAHAPSDRETPARQQTVTGRLRAVSDGTPGEPPATARERAPIAHSRQAGGYRDETDSALAGLACGEKVVERLSREQVRRLTWLLELAVAGRVSEPSLVDAVTRASRRADHAAGVDELGGALPRARARAPVGPDADRQGRRRDGRRLLHRPAVRREPLGLRTPTTSAERSSTSASAGRAPSSARTTPTSCASSRARRCAPT
jgi:hypothetical protein